jgi:hypothetical protein
VAAQRRTLARRLSAAQERVRRLAKAREAQAEIERQREEQRQKQRRKEKATDPDKEARASTVDPEARLTLPEVAAVAQAFADAGRPSRAVDVWRAGLGAAFLSEAAVARQVEDVGGSVQAATKVDFNPIETIRNEIKGSSATTDAAQPGTQPVSLAADVATAAPLPDPVIPLPEPPPPLDVSAYAPPEPAPAKAQRARKKAAAPEGDEA